MGMIAGKQKEAITRRTDGDVAVQLGIAGAVDFAHPALAEESNDAVAVGEHRAGRESAFVQGAGCSRCAGRWHHSRGRRRCRS